MKYSCTPAHLLTVLLFAAPAAAQSAPAAHDRPFLFSISTPHSETRHATVQLDTGVGERPFDIVEGDRPEQRLGIQASLGNRITLLARIGVASDRNDVQTSQQAEMLYSVVHAPRHRGSVALGMGVRHESAGVNVLLGRVAAGRTFSTWRLDGNALFEKPFSPGRDPVDVITTLGFARRSSGPSRRSRNDRRRPRRVLGS